MRCTFAFLVLALAMTVTSAAAQTKTRPGTKPREGSAKEEAQERSVHITKGPHVSNVTANAATIAWETNKQAANELKYRAKNSANWQSAYSAGGSTNHVVNLTGLQPGTVYDFQIMTGEQEMRTSGSFRTQGSPAAGATEGSRGEEARERAVHITNGPHVMNVGPNSATVAWSTNENAANDVKYRVKGSGAWQTAYDPGGSTNHVVNLTGLQPNKTYEFQIMTREHQVRTSGTFHTK